MEKQMNKEILKKLKRMLTIHEGVRYHPYKDTKGILTIGCGRNLESRGLLPKEVDFMLENDINYFFDYLSHFSWFSQLNDARKAAIVDMSFMGLKNLFRFKKMIAALEKEDFDQAAEEVLNSRYATQVGKRANDIANTIRSGEVSI